MWSTPQAGVWILVCIEPPQRGVHQCQELWLLVALSVLELLILRAVEASGSREEEP